MRRAKVTVFIHFVWSTWDRLPLLTESVQEQIYRALGAKCAELGAEIVALGGVEDHIHLLVEMPATVSIADLVGQMKGASSHLMAQHVLAPTRGFFKWQGAYGAFSVNPQHLREVADYILHQREHHALGTLKAEWEYSAEEKEVGTTEAGD